MKVYEEISLQDFEFWSGAKYEYGGESHTLKEWAQIIGTCYHTLNCRITQYGWSFEKAITTPIKKSGNYCNKKDN